MSAILETAGALVLVLAPLGRIVRFNRACEQTTHYSFEEVKGHEEWLKNPGFWENHVHSNDRKQVVAQRNIDTQAKYRVKRQLASGFDCFLSKLESPSRLVEVISNLVMSSRRD